MAARIDERALADLLGRIAHEVEAGRLPNAQTALALDGDIVCNASFGTGTDATRFVTFSTTKALVASAVWTFLAPSGDGPLRLSGRIAEWFPEFGASGKEAVTLEQVLLHTGGFPRAPLGPPAWFSREQRIEAMASWRLNWEPGTRCEYHATSAHWVLAELLERVGGADFRDVVHARVTAPLGLPRMLGIPEAEQHDIAPVVRFGEPPTAAEIEDVTGIAGLDGVELPDEIDDLTLARFNEPATRALGVPGGGAVATAATFARFYQGLLHDDGCVWDPDVLADGTSHVRCRLVDPVRGVPANRTIGLLVAGGDGGAMRRGFGLEASPRAFGHDGAGGQLAWADPDTGSSFCFLTSGLDRNPLRDGRRQIAIATRAERCVSAARAPHAG
jgi:CubicO group peptidase (beta-lactamase class C family)